MDALDDFAATSPPSPSVSGLKMHFQSFSSPEMQRDFKQKEPMMIRSGLQPRSPSCPSAIRVPTDHEVDMNYSGFVDLDYSLEDGEDLDIV